MPLAQRLWQWQPYSPAAALRGSQHPSRTLQLQLVAGVGGEGMGMGTAGVPRGAGCWGQVGCPGGASPSHPHPSGPGRGYSSALKHRLAVTLWQTAPRRWLHGRGPRAPCRQVVASSCDTSDTTMPMQIPLPSLAAASNGQRWGRGPRHPLSLPFSAFWGGCVLWQHRVSLWSWRIPRRRSGQPPAWQGGDLPTRRVRDNACVPAWCPPPGPARVMPKGSVPAKPLMEIFCRSLFRFHPGARASQGLVRPWPLAVAVPVHH